LNSGKIITKHEEVQFIIRFKPADTGDAMMYINKSQADILNHSVDEKGHFVHIKMRKSFSQQLLYNLDKTGKFEHQLFK
jgi:hypothetical protein